MRKNTAPSTAMAKRFRPTKSQESGEMKRFSPEGHNAEIQSEWRHQRPWASLKVRLKFTSSVEITTVFTHDKEKNYKEVTTFQI